jgi:hypothetical protein
LPVRIRFVDRLDQALNVSPPRKEKAVQALSIAEAKVS